MGSVCPQGALSSFGDYKTILIAALSETAVQKHLADIGRDRLPSSRRELL